MSFVYSTVLFFLVLKTQSASYSSFALMMLQKLEVLCLSLSVYKYLTSKESVIEGH